VVVKGDKTLYRARFAGFQQKDEAEAVCKQLKLRDVDCTGLLAARRHLLVRAASGAVLGHLPLKAFFGEG
jgi:hypothetical protein